MAFRGTTVIAAPSLTRSAMRRSWNGDTVRPSSTTGPASFFRIAAARLASAASRMTRGALRETRRNSTHALRRFDA